MILVHSALRAPPPEMRPSFGLPPSSLVKSSESLRPNATPSSTARVSAPRLWRRLRPTNAPVRRGRRAGSARRRGRAGRSVLRRRAAIASASLRSVSNWRSGSVDVAEPGERAGGRQHHAHRVPFVGDGVAERVDAGLLVCGELRRARRTRRPRCRPRPTRGPGRSTPTPSAPAAWSPAPAATGSLSWSFVRRASGSRALLVARPGRCRARRGPPRSSFGSPRRAGASRTRRRRRWRARRSGGGGRSPWAGATLAMRW